MDPVHPQCFLSFSAQLWVGVLVDFFIVFHYLVVIVIVLGCLPLIFVGVPALIYTFISFYTIIIIFVGKFARSPPLKLL